MVSVILGLKWPCINGLDKTLINEEFYIVITAGNERKTVLLSMWQLFLLPGKDNFHQITLLSPPFTLMQSVAVHCFCSFLPCGRIINRTFLIFFLLSISVPQHIYETFFSSIPRKKLHLLAAMVCLSDIHLLNTMAMYLKWLLLRIWQLAAW